MRHPKIRASLVAAAVLLSVSGFAGQAPSGLDFQPLEKVVAEELRKTLVRDGNLLLKQNNREQPLVKFGDDDLRTDGGRFVFVRNTSGVIEYMHSGSRSWRKVR